MKDATPKRILVSVLGTGHYDATTYHLGGESLRTRLQGQLLWRILNPDAIVVCGTQECWTTKRDYPPEEGGPQSNWNLLQGLAEGEGRKETLHQVTWATALDPEALLANHLKLRKTLLDLAPPWEAVAIHLDLTHGFRIQPMALLLSVRLYCALARREGLAGPRLAGAYYGAFDGQADTDLVDVTELITTLDWISGLETWLDTGVSSGLERMKRHLPSIQKTIATKQGERLVAGDHPMSQALDLVHQRSLAVAMNNRRAIAGAEEECWKKVVRAGAQRPMGRYLEGFSDLLRDVWHLEGSAPNPWVQEKQESWETLNWMASQAKLRFEEGRLLQAVTLVRESLARAVGLRFEETAGIRVDPDFLFGYLTRPDDALELPPGAPAPLAATLAFDRAWRAMDSGRWRIHALQIARTRNDLAHLNLSTNTSTDAFRALGMIQGLVDWARAAIEAMPRLTPEPAPRATSGHFWNLTNHPLAGWPETQRFAAEAYGTEDSIGPRVLREVEMPIVDPMATSQEVTALARDLVAKVRGLGGCPGEPVLVMGESTLTHALVCELKQWRFVPLAATTRRDSEESLAPDGSVVKRSRFQFCGLRAYS
jgi:hypothetical protein